MPFVGGCLAATLAALCALFPGAASAQAPSRVDEARARALFEEGRRAAEAERWVEALDAFQRSRALANRPSTVFNVATTLVRLGRAREVLAALDELEAIATPREHARLLASAAELRAQAAALLRRVTLRIAPADAIVEIDGAILEGAGPERLAVLDPGPRAVVVRAEGHEEARFTLEPGIERHDVALRPLDATLRVVPSIASARVAVDGVERGVGALELSLAPGTHALGITAEGHVPFERDVELAPGARLTVDAALEPLPPGEDLVASPAFWGVVGGGVAVLAAVGIALGVVFGSTTEAPYGGTSNTVIVPLLEGTLP